MATTAIVKNEAGIWREEEVGFTPDGRDEGSMGRGYEWLKKGGRREVALGRERSQQPSLMGDRGKKRGSLQSRDSRRNQLMSHRV